DRVGVAARLDRVALFDLLVEERVEAVLASSERVDLSHGREYRNRGSQKEYGVGDWPCRQVRPGPATHRRATAREATSFRRTDCLQGQLSRAARRVQGCSPLAEPVDGSCEAP